MDSTISATTTIDGLRALCPVPEAAEALTPHSLSAGGPFRILLSRDGQRTFAKHSFSVEGLAGSWDAAQGVMLGNATGDRGCGLPHSLAGRFHLRPAQQPVQLIKDMMLGPSNIHSTPGMPVVVDERGNERDCNCCSAADVASMLADGTTLDILVEDRRQKYTSRRSRCTIGQLRMARLLGAPWLGQKGAMATRPRFFAAVLAAASRASHKAKLAWMKPAVEEALAAKERHERALAAGFAAHHIKLAAAQVAHGSLRPAARAWQHAVKDAQPGQDPTPLAISTYTKWLLEHDVRVRARAGRTAVLTLWGELQSRQPVGVDGNAIMTSLVAAAYCEYVNTCITWRVWSPTAKHSPTQWSQDPAMESRRTAALHSKGGGQLAWRVATLYSKRLRYLRVHRIFISDHSARQTGAYGTALQVGA